MLKARKIQSVLLAFAALLVGVGMAHARENAQVIENLTMKDAVAIGVYSNPQYEAARAERLAAEQMLQQAKAGFLPVVDLRAETGLEYNSRSGIRNANRWRKQATMSLTQLLYDGNETRNLVRERAAGLQSQTARLRETTELLGLDIVSAYLEVLRQRKQVAVARENISQHQALLKTLEEAASAGTVSNGDVEQARARLAASSADLYSVLQSLADADANFRRVVGFAPGKLADAGDPAIVLQPDVEAIVAAALENSPTLAVLGSNVKQAEARFDKASAAFFPQFDFVVDGRKGNDVDGMSGRNDEASAQVVMRWNLFRGGADRARKIELGHRASATRSRQEDARRAVEEDIRRTWSAMKNSMARAAQFGAQAAANERVVAVYKDQFNLGRRTLLDVLDAQNEWFITRLSHINAGYTALLAKYRLLALQGRLLSFLDVHRGGVSATAASITEPAMDPANKISVNEAAIDIADDPAAKSDTTGQKETPEKESKSKKPASEQETNSTRTDK